MIVTSFQTVREAAGYSREQVAQALCVSHDTINRIEKDPMRYNLYTLLRYAGFLQCPLVQLVPCLDETPRVPRCHHQQEHAS
jgi:transcriptional regulator with XRE-family HTH domain